MKNCFKVLDAAGKAHTHDLFKDKEFVSPGEVIQTVVDHNREAGQPGSKVKKFEGEIMVFNFITF